MSKHLDLTRARMEAVRESVAGELLTRQKMMEFVGLAAGRGLERVVITAPAHPLKLRHTAAAIDATAWLEKLGFRPRWIEDRRHGADDLGDALEIEW